MKSAVTVEDCIFTGNEAVGSGAAIGVWHTENSVVKHCEFTDNAAHSFGGAIYVSANAHIPFTECTIHDNTASTRGGAIYVDASGLLQSNGNRMENNTAANGGAVYIAESGSATMTDDTIMGNKAKIGSAIYSSGVLEMCGVQITGNKATDHTAVYLDGTSNDALTMNATCKFGGDLVIRDNDGGDAYVTNDGIIFVNTDGLGTNAHIALQLESGIISNMVFGTYDYEKLTECNYLLTAGTRSITDPESGMIQTDGMSNIWLYVAIGVCAVLVILILVIVLLKRRKQKKEN